MRPALRRRRDPRQHAVPGAEVERRIVDALQAATRPLGAYDLLERLTAHGTRYPTAVYRALERLNAAGTIERVEVTSAYRLRESVGSVLVTCSKCGSTSAEPAVEARAALAGSLIGVGYLLDRLVLEAIGVCPACVGGGSQSDSEGIAAG